MSKHEQNTRDEFARVAAELARRYSVEAYARVLWMANNNFIDWEKEAVALFPLMQAEIEMDEPPPAPQA